MLSFLKIRSLSNIRIATRLAIMSGLSILLVAMIVGAALMTDSGLKKADADVNFQRELQLGLTQVKTNFRSLQAATHDIRTAAGRAELATAGKEVARHHLIIDKYLEFIIPQLADAQRQARIKKLRALNNNYFALAKQIDAAKAKALDLAGKASIDGAMKIASLNDEIQHTFSEKMLPLEKEMEGLLDRGTDDAFAVVKQMRAASAQATARAETFEIILGALAVLVLIGSAVFGFLSIARPLAALRKPINAVAAGNFDVAVAIPGRQDEIGEIAAAVQTIVDEVGSAVSNIKRAAGEVTGAAAEISSSTTDLSQRTEEQAASLEQTSASMEQISATVRNNAENALQANTFANETNVVAERGGAVVGEAVSAMARIEESSRKISEIIGVIDEIARQTNLLALNAAVEAARAGEAGRGFAVVASEVRTLAQRSSQAAKDIKDLIVNSGNQVKDGVALVNKAGDSLNEIVASIQKVTAIVADIANASAEQSTGLEQINKALTQMDEVTQQNSALVEENAATAKTLEQQAKAMDAQVAYFKIGNAADSAGTPPVTVADQKPAAKPKRAAPQTVKASAAPKRVPAAAKEPESQPAKRPQTAGATALKADADWDEF